MRECAAEGCGVLVRGRVLMCRPHWVQVSRPTQNRVYSRLGSHGAGCCTGDVPVMRQGLQSAAADATRSLRGNAAGDRGRTRKVQGAAETVTTPSVASVPMPAVCVHYWRVETPAGRAYSPGVCLRCGETRLFGNRWVQDDDGERGAVLRQETPYSRTRGEQGRKHRRNVGEEKR